MRAACLWHRDVIRQYFRGEAMRESVIYQDILQQGLQQGESSIVLRLLTRRLGAIPDEMRLRIQT